MDRKRLSLIVTVFLVFFCGCGSLEQADKNKKGEEKQMTNFVLDPNFENGAQIFSPGKPMTYSGKLDFGRDVRDKTASWLLTQWNSRNNIRLVKGERSGGRYVYENEFKTVALDDDGTLTLRVNAGKEYPRPRKSLMDPWVHLYFEQRYLEPYPIGNADKMKLGFSFSIPFFKDHTPEGELDPGLHASIAVFYIIVKDINPDSPGFNDFINFCVMLFDNRSGVTKESWHLDSGQNPVDATNMMIYTMDSSVYTDPVYADGAWHEVDFDPLPYIRKAFETAQENNFMKGSSFEDLAVSSVFFGFEVPGVMDSEMRIRDIFLGAMQ